MPYGNPEQREAEKLKKLKAATRTIIERTVDPSAPKPKHYKRPRLVIKDKTHKNKGGWRGHPNSLAALAEARKRTLFVKGEGAVNMARCTFIRRNGQRCARPAVREYDKCFTHGGSRIQMLRRLRDNCVDADRGRYAWGTLRRMSARGDLPEGLAHSEAFVAVSSAIHESNRAMRELRQTGEQRSTADARRMAALRNLAFELASGWQILQETGNYSFWGQAVAKTRELGLIP